MQRRNRITKGLSVFLAAVMILSSQSATAMATTIGIGMIPAAQEETEQVNLETTAKQEVLEEEGILSVKYTIEVYNPSQESSAEGVAVKAALGENSVYYSRQGETSGLSVSEGLAQVEELQGEEGTYASSVVWGDQEIGAGETKDYVFYTSLNDWGGVNSTEDLPFVCFVNGVQVENVQWINAEILESWISQPQTYTYSDEFVKITVEPDEETTVPRDAVLEAKVAAQDSSEYKEAAEAVSQSDTDFQYSDFVIYDLQLTSEQQETMDASGSFQVNIEFLQGALKAEDAASSADDIVKVFRISEDGVSELSAEIQQSVPVSVDGAKFVTDDLGRFVIARASKKDTVTTYQYEDSNIKVTATLQYADAVPDDAEFRVTPVTASSSGYNYDAYMQALNEKLDSEAEYTEENTLLYDIAFLVDKRDENGNVIPGEKEEYQPESGSVSISFVFKQNQLSEDLEAEQEDVSVVHLPLSQGVKEEVDTTSQATNISSGDVQVETVENSVNLAGKGGTDQAQFSLSDFSVTAFVNNGPTFTPGTSRSFRDILGDAVYYGITVEDLNKTGHMDTNFATNYFTGTGNVTAGAYTGNGAGVYVISDMSEGSDLPIDGKSTDVWCTDNIKDKITLINNNTGQKIVYKKETLTAYVSGLISHAAGVSAAMASEETNAVTVNMNNTVIDLENYPAGTYYFDGDSIFEIIQSGGLKISKNDNQVVVFNFENSSVELREFSVNGKNSSTSDGSMDMSAQTIVFNMPNATQVTFSSGVAGIFLAPNAKVWLNSTSSGWLVANKLMNTGGEWHCVWGEMPGSSEIPAPASLKAVKKVNGAVPSSEDDTFTFLLEKWGGEEWLEVERKENNGSQVSFSQLSFNEEGDYYYRISEIEGNGNYTYDTNKYIAKIEVGKNEALDGQGGLSTTYYIKGITYYDCDDVAEVANAEQGSASSQAVFNTIKEGAEKGRITVTKTVKVNGETTTGSEMDGTYYFGLYKTQDGQETLVGNIQSITVTNGSAQGSVTFENLEPGEYTVKELSDENGSGVYAQAGVAVTGDGVQEVTLQAGGSQNVEFVNDKTHLGSLTIQKKLEGAESGSFAFTVTKGNKYYAADGTESDTEVRLEMECSGTKSVTVKNLKPGTYTVTEVSDKTGYVVSGEGAVTVKGGQETKVEITNTARGKITVTKTVKVNGEPTTETQMDGTYYFGLYKTQDGQETLVGNIQSIKVENGRAQGSVIFENLEPGEYTVKELSDGSGSGVYAQAGVVVTGNGVQEVTLQAGGSQNVGFVNDKTHLGSLTIQKKLEGAESGSFAFTVTKGNKYYTVNGTESDKEVRLEIQYPGTKSVTVKNLKPGTYTVTEVSDKTGYVVSGEGDVTVTGGQGTTAEITNTAIGTVSVGLEASKTLTGAALKGGDFTFTLENGDEDTPAVSQTKTNDGSGKVAFDEIIYDYEDAGKTYTYKVKEQTGNTAGVDYDDTEYTVKVKISQPAADGSLTAETAVYKQGADGSLEEAEGILFGNTFEGSVKLTKTDTEGKTLSGAEFQLYKKQADESYQAYSTPGNANGLYTTDGQGVLEAAGLAEGEYYFIETKAPEGFVISTDSQGQPLKYTFEIVYGEADVSAEVTAVNEEGVEGYITVTKRTTQLDGTEYQNIAGEEAVFYVGIFKDEAGTQPYGTDHIKEIRMIGESVSQQVTFSGLETGTYYILETTSEGTPIALESSQEVNGSEFVCLIDGEGTNEVELDLTGGKTEGEVKLNNVYSEMPEGFYVEGQIDITKRVLRNGKEMTTDETFFAGIFTQDEEGVQTLYTVVALNQNGAVSANVPLGGEDGTQPVTYYVYETDNSGTPVDHDAFAYEVSGEGTVTVTSADAQAITITNSIEETEETEEITETTEEESSTERTSSSGGGKSVKTGDPTNALPYLISLAAAAAVLAGLIIIGKKRKNYKK